MAVRKVLTQKQRTRDKIKASQLLNRLQNNALGLLKNPMDSNQIRCAQILIDKTLPNLQALAVEAEIDHEITIKWQK
jgi:hypothetical protein